LIKKHYLQFENDLPVIVAKLGFEPDEAQYGDVLQIIGSCLRITPSKSQPRSLLVEQSEPDVSIATCTKLGLLFLL
jgi:hypothetical protein